MAEGSMSGLDDLLAAIEKRDAGSRLVLAIAGPPGAGKSTLAEALAARLNAKAPGCAAVLPMDGYHYDDRVLHDLGLRPRKGAPETFDVAGLSAMLVRLRRNEEEVVAVPVFDRDLEIARAGARLIPRSVRVIVTEGNYLLLNKPPWSGLRTLFDLTVMLNPSEAVLRQRLTERWRGYALTSTEIAAKLDGTDLPNGRLVMAESWAPDFWMADWRALPA